MTDKSGTIVTMEDEDKISVKTPVTMTCDGPKCGSRFERDNPTTVEWIEEEVREHPEIIPDAFWQFIRMGVNPASPKELALCSVQCVKDYLTYSYTPPPSYKEQMAALEKLANDTQAINSANAKTV